jgi:hypothetical protein
MEVLECFRLGKLRTAIVGLGMAEMPLARKRNHEFELWKAEGNTTALVQGQAFSGFRANLGVGDDLFGSREDAYSETVRQKRWDWYQDDFSARQAHPNEHALARG